MFVDANLYDIITGTGQFGKFDRTPVLVPDISLCSVRGTGHFRNLISTSIPVPSLTSTDFHIGTGHFVNFGTTSIPVRGT